MSQHKRRKAAKEKAEAMLDEALRESFPASDPVALSQPSPAPHAPEQELSPARRGAATRDKSTRPRRH